ncbi:MAG: MFS transporter [Dehalococcoidia bacterium]
MKIGGRSFHYGWVVVGASTLIIFINTTLFLTFPIFLEPISEAMGWSRGTVSGAYALHWMVGAMAVFGVGWFVDRYGTRKTLILGSILSAVSLTLTGLSEAPWQLYLSYGVLFGIARSCFLVPIHITVGLWFQKKLGVALGVVNISMALGPLIMSPVVRILLDQMGWGNTFILLGLSSGVLQAGFAWFVRTRPQDIGLKPYGEDEAATPTGESLMKRRPRFYTEDTTNFFRYAARTQPFKYLILIHFLGCASHSIPLTHVVAMATDVGTNPLAAATILSMMSFFAMSSNFGSSILSDVAGGKRTLALVMLLQAGGILILLGARDLWVFYLFTMFFGLGYGGEMVAFPIINRQYYGNAPIGKVYSAQMVGAGLGMAGGAYIGGLLFDVMGNYTGAIWLSAILSGLGLLAVYRLVSPFTRSALGGEAGQP